ncbi:MAG: cupin domain-containing protein, partial [Rhizobacter sp.]
MTPIPTHLPTPLLGGLSPQVFMRHHWQKKPLLVRQALPMTSSFVGRAELFALAAREGVESRLVTHRAGRWSLRHGPLPRRALPPLAQREWTLLVQGLDLHLDSARALLERFRFVPDARLDDVMVSYASDGGGVGPHVDSYDVFLLQIHGVRRWRIGRVKRPQLQPGVPLKILGNFVAQDEWRLEPGDMLYLPPGWAHDGVAEGECMTASIGFRAPGGDELARELLQRTLDADEPASSARLY